jgi:hypothetical protein
MKGVVKPQARPTSRNETMMLRVGGGGGVDGDDGDGDGTAEGE